MDVGDWIAGSESLPFPRCDTPAVIAQLRKLRNVRYHDRPALLYGGIVDLLPTSCGRTRSRPT